MTYYFRMLPDLANFPYQALLADLTLLVLHAQIPDTVAEHFHKPLPVTVLTPGLTVPLTHAVKPAFQMPVVGLIGISAWTKAETTISFHQ